MNKEMEYALDRARLEYPPREGWEVFPVGSRVVAWNKWGGHRVDVCRVPTNRDDCPVDFSAWRTGL